MEDENIELLGAYGYTYTDKGAIVDAEGNYVPTVDLNGATLSSYQDEDSYNSGREEQSRMEEEGYVYDSSSLVSESVQKDVHNSKMALKRYEEDPSLPGQDDNETKEAAFQALQAEKEENGEDTYPNAQTQEVELEKDVPEVGPMFETLRGLEQSGAVEKGHVNTYKQVLKDIEALKAEDKDLDEVMVQDRKAFDKELEENSWYDPENLGLYGQKAMSHFWEMVTPTGTGMKEENKAKYTELLNKKKQLEAPKFQTEIDTQSKELEALLKIREENGSGYALDQAIGKKQQRIAEMESYLSHDSDNWFTSNLNAVLESGERAIRTFTLMDGIHNFTEVRTSYNNYAEGKATEEDMMILENFAQELAHEELMASANSRGAVDDTVRGVVGSLGFMADYVTGKGAAKTAAKKGGKTIAKTASKFGIKMLDDAAMLAIRKLGKRVPRAITGTTKAVAEAAVVPLTMRSTWEGASKNIYDIKKDKDGKLMIGQELYDHNLQEATNRWNTSKQILDHLEAKPELTPKEKKDLEEVMSYVGDNRNIHGVERNKAIPTHSELVSNMDNNVTLVEAVTEEAKKNAAEILSEKVGGIALPKWLKDKIPTTGLVGKLTQTNKAVQKASKGLIHSPAGELFEENLVPVFGYILNGNESELHSMMNLEAQEAVVLQTLAMQGLMRGPSAVAGRFTKKGRENRAEINRLSELYKDIGNAGSKAELDKIMDFTSIPGVTNTRSAEEIRNLETLGKTEEASKKRQALFSFNAMQAVRTGTTKEFTQALTKLEGSQTLSAQAKADVAEAKRTLGVYDKYITKYNQREGKAAIINNLMNRDIHVRKIKEAKQDVETLITDNRDAYNEYEVALDSEVTKFEEQHGVEADILNAVPGNVGKQYSDPVVQEEYHKLIAKVAKKFSPEVRSIVAQSIGIVTPLTKSLKEVDAVHIDLNSTEKQKQLKAERLLDESIKNKLNKARKGKNIDFTQEELDMLKNKSRNTESTEEVQEQEIANLAEEKEIVAEVTPEPGVQTKMDFDEAEGMAQAIKEFSTEPTETKDTALGFSPEDAGGISDADLGIEDVLFSPQSANYSDAFKEVSKNAVEEVDSDLGKTADFKEFVGEYVKSHGYKVIKEKFTQLKKIWDATGRDVSTADAVYSKMFDAKSAALNFEEAIENPMDNSNSTREVEINTKAEEAIVEQTTKKENFQPDSQVADIQESREDKRTLNSDPKLAYNFQNSRKDPEGKWKIMSKGLKEFSDKSVLNSHAILDPDFATKGTQFEIRPLDIDRLSIGEGETWGSFKAANPTMTEGSPLWVAKIPMAINHVAEDGTNTVVSMLHEASWYNENNISDREGIDTQRRVADAGFEKAAKMREQAYAGNNKIVITDKKFGSLDNLANHVSNTPVSLNEATGDTTLGVIRYENNVPRIVTDSKNNSFDGMLSTDLMQKDKFGRFLYREGDTIEIRHVHTVEGNKVHMAFKTMTDSPFAEEGPLKNTLNPKIVNNMKFATLTSVLLNNQGNTELISAIEKKYNFTIQKAKALRDSVKADTFIDLENGLTKYAGVFIQVGSTNKDPNQVLNSATNPEGKPHFTDKYFDKKQNKWRTSGYALQAYHKVKGSVKNFSVGGKLRPSPSITPTDQVNMTMSSIDKLFNEGSGLFKMNSMHVNKQYLNKDTHSITEIDSEGKAVPSSKKTITDFVKDNVKTNILSHEIETIGGETKWVTDVQPMIYFDLNSQQAPTETALTNDEIEALLGGQDTALGTQTTTVTPTIKREGVSEVYTSNSEISNIGTAEQYEAYLSTIFPNSKVKDVVYHGTTQSFEQYSIKGDFGFHFGPKKAAEERLEQKFQEDNKEDMFHIPEEVLREQYSSKIYSNILNIKNPFRVPDSSHLIEETKLEAFLKEGIITKEEYSYYKNLLPEMPTPSEVGGMNEYFDILENYSKDPKTIAATKKIEEEIGEKLKDSKYDGLVYENKHEAAGEDSYIALDKDQIHILGSKKDVQGFKKYVGSVKTPTSMTNTIESIKSTLSEADMLAFQQMVEAGIFNEDTEFNSRIALTEEQQQRLTDQENTLISSLTALEQRQLVSSLKNSVLTELNTGDITPARVHEVLAESINNNIVPQIETKKRIVENISKLPNMGPIVEKITNLVDKLEAVVSEQEKLIGTSKENPGELTESLGELLAVDLSQSKIDEEDSFAKSFLEKSLKLGYSVKLKLGFFGIEKRDKNNNIQTNFTGLPTYNNPDSIVDKILEVTSTIPSNWNMLIDKLDDKFVKSGERIYSQIKHKLEALPKSTKNELLYKTISKKLDIYKVINSPKIEYNKDGKPVVTSYTLKMYDENSSKEKFRRTSEILNNFVNSPMGITKDSKRVLNRVFAANLEKRLVKLNKDQETNFDTIKELFQDIGLESISDNTIENFIATNGLYGSTGLITYLMANNSSLLVNSTSKDLALDTTVNNVFLNMSSPFNKLINTEIDLNSSFIAKAIRVGDKVMQGVIANTAVHDMVQKYKTGEVGEILADTYSSNNFIAKTLQADDKFKKAYSVGFSSPDAYKIHGKKNFRSADYDQITPEDNMATVLGLYTNTRGNSELSDKELTPGLDFRIGQMTSGTLSDKGRMLYFTTAMLNLKGSDITVAEDVTLDSLVSNFLLEQVFDGELGRILNSYEKGSNFTNYEQTSKIFTTIPSFNAIEYNGKNIHTYLGVVGKTEGAELPADFKSVVRAEAKLKLQDYINSEVKNKISVDGTSGELVDFGMYDPSIADESIAQEGNNVKHIDTAFVQSKPGETNLQKLRYTMAEFAINNLLNQNNVYQMYLGDIAFYSKGKAIPTITTDGKKRVDGNKLKDPKVYGKIARQIGTIIDKRAALLIAPGLKLANAESPIHEATEFVHIAMNDTVSMSSTIKNLVEARYGKDNAKTNAAIDRILEIEDRLALEGVEKSMAKVLKDEKEDLIQNELTEIKDYFEIEGTDAQEYTTWKTHLDMLMRQGTMTEEQHNTVKSAYAKLSAGQEIDANEIDVLMQPVKPVYTGLTNHSGVMRPVYIKASSFPLLPQVTKNLKMDKVRERLETLEEQHKKPVRMSYQTANKIGSLNSNLSMESMYSDADLTEEMNSSMSILPMSNFKIQQETPSKETKAFKKGKDSHITMGSQFFKIILGNGINKIEEKIFPNLFSKDLTERLGIAQADKLSGRELDQIYFDVYSEYSDLQKEGLEFELGLHGDLPFKDMSNSRKNSIVENLHKLLKAEIESRGYPDYLKDSISLIEENGLKEVLVPLMLDSNSHKFEALLQSIVSKRMITHTLPGNGHIAASSEGFTRKTNLDALTANERQGIVWTDGREDGELRATTNADGKITSAEILVKSHYKTRDAEGNFKYIDLTSDQYSEAITNENGEVTGRRLKTEMIDEEILNMFSFRIPTSSHQLGAIVKVVGFLPAETGDILIVPKEHTTQLGEDYDIDKRMVYKSNYIVGRDGKVNKLQYRKRKELEKDKYEDQVNKLFKAMFGKESESLLEEEQLSIRQKDAQIRIKMLENGLIDVYKSVYSSPDTEIQKKIFSPLITDVAEETAFAMEAYLAESVDDTNFSLVSDSYQRELLKSGADGKSGIAIHANAVTLEAQFQRIADHVKIGITEGYKSDGNPIPSQEVIGSIEPGKLGTLGKNIRTLDGLREIAEHHGENTNVATDNINKQIMAKRNENSYTMGVYAYMAHLGYDQTFEDVVTSVDSDGTQVKGRLHIPSLFINQPIIRDYVRLKQEKDRLTAEYSQDAEEEILMELAKKYQFNVQPGASMTNFKDDTAYSVESTHLTGQALWDNLKEENASKELQSTILQKYARFEKQSRELSEFQQVISLSSSQLGVSYFETLQRISTLDRMAEKGTFSNVSKLVGEFIVAPTSPSGLPYTLEEELAKVSRDPKLSAEVQEKINKVKDGGYTLIGKNYWKPTTVEGKMLVNAVSAANELLPIFFPYKSSFVNSMINRIFGLRDVDPNKKSKSILSAKYEIMSSFNDFLSSQIGVFKGDISQERKRLFFDENNNTSLASVIKSLKDSNHPVMENALLKGLILEIKPGDISLIKSTITHDTDFGTASNYEAFMELLADTSSIGTHNGQEMTVSQLAQDLVSYSFLADNQNGATGFKNFVSIEYLDIIGVTAKQREVFKKINNDAFTLKQLQDNFTRQYFQHNPNKGKIIKLEDATVIASNKDGVTEFKTDVESRYISLRDNNVTHSTKQWGLFEYDKTSKTHKKIDVLGTSGYNEYDSNKSTQKTSLKMADNSIFMKNKTGQYFFRDSVTNKRFNLMSIGKLLPESLGTKGILETILGSPTTSAHHKSIISNFIEHSDLNTTIIYGQPNNSQLGQYNVSTDEITIDKDIYEKLLQKHNGDFAKVNGIVKEIVIEEIIHASTVKQFKKYVAKTDIDGTVSLLPNAPVFAKKLVALYEIARTTIPYNSKDISTYYSKNIYEFMAGMFIDENYRDSLEAKSEGFANKFKDMLKSLFQYLYNSSTGGTLKYTDEVYKAVGSLLQSNEVNRKTESARTPLPPLSGMPKSKINPNTGKNDTGGFPNIEQSPKDCN